MTTAAIVKENACNYDSLSSASESDSTRTNFWAFVHELPAQYVQAAEHVQPETEKINLQNIHRCAFLWLRNSITWFPTATGNATTSFATA